MNTASTVVLNVDFKLFEEEEYKELTQKEKKELKDWYNEVIEIMGNEILKMIGKISSNSMEREMNERGFTKELFMRENTSEALECMIMYINLTWMVHCRKENKKLARKNKKIIRRVARKYESIMEFDVFSFT